MIRLDSHVINIDQPTQKVELSANQLLIQKATIYIMYEHSTPSIAFHCFPMWCLIRVFQPLNDGSALLGPCGSTAWPLWRRAAQWQRTTVRWKLGTAMAAMALGLG